MERDAGLNRGYTYRERIARVSPGTTVLDHLAARHRHTPREVWRERVEAGRVLVDGVPALPDAPLVEGMELAWLRPPWREPVAPLDYGVLHADGQVLAVDKPAGLPTLPGGGFLEHTLLHRVRSSFPEAVPVHRLGRWTSGIVLFALTPAARTLLTGALREGSAWKRYRALASGCPARDCWTVDVPIGPVPHARLGTVHGASAGGRPAASEIMVLERRDGAFLADVVIGTGRPHQIRIHLAAGGHPLVGDPLYPAGGVPEPEAVALPGDPGYLLHAAGLRVAHPAGGGELAVASLPPPGLRTAAERAAR